MVVNALLELVKGFFFSLSRDLHALIAFFLQKELSRKKKYNISIIVEGEEVEEFEEMVP